MYKKVLINNLKVKNKYNVIKKIKKTKLNLYINSSYTLFTYGVFCWWTKSFVCIVVSNNIYTVLYTFIEFINKSIKNKITGCCLDGCFGLSWLIWRSPRCLICPL